MHNIVFIKKKALTLLNNLLYFIKQRDLGFNFFLNRHF